MTVGLPSKLVFPKRPKGRRDVNINLNPKEKKMIPYRFLLFFRRISYDAILEAYSCSLYCD